MKPLRYILCALVAMSLAGLLQSCTFELEPGKDAGRKEVPADKDATYLVLRIGAVGGHTRAGDGNSIEQINSLRIVVLDGDGKVEHNIKETFDATDFEEYSYSKENLIIRTTPTDKKIYLFANEESVTGLKGTTGNLTELLDSYQKGKEGFADAIKDAYFTPDFNRNIFLSSYYEIDAKEFEGTNSVEKEFYLVRAASKFEFELVNNLPIDLTIEGLTVSSVVDDMYLMPHVNDKFEDEGGNMKVPAGKSYTHWIEWLKDVCEATTKTQTPVDDNESVNYDYGWILDYNIPNENGVQSTPNHKPLKIVQQSGLTLEKNGAKLSLPQVYCAESKYQAENGNGVQAYSFTLQLKDNAGTVKTFNEKLNNLSALFRNTHVKVNIEILQNEENIELHLWIGICPWVVEEIDIPTFD